MEKNKSYRTDSDIAFEFDHLFAEIPEPSSQEDVRAYLLEADYDVEKLKAEGEAFARELIASNWRFVNPQDIRAAASKINEVPIRMGWDRHQLDAAIKKVSVALGSGGTQLSLAFRNLDELTDTDLKIILQELEYKARDNGISLDLDQ